MIRQLEKPEMYQLMNIAFSNQYSDLVKEVDENGIKYSLLKIGENDWIPIIAQNNYDIFTREEYMNYNRSNDCFCDSKFYYYMMTKKPYQYYVAKKATKEITQTFNMDEYNKLFYDGFSLVYPSNIIDYIKLLEKYGKQTYVDSINSLRKKIMYDVYDKYIMQNNELDIKENNANEEVKKLINKII